VEDKMDKREQIQRNNEKIKEIKTEIYNIISAGRAEEEPDYVEYDDSDNYEEYMSSEIHRLSEEERNITENTRKIRADIEKEEFEKEYEILSKKYKAGKIASDKESSVDTLSRELYAKVVARFIAKKETDTPINIGVFGEWGEGKSSFLRLIEKEMDFLNSRKWEHVSKIHIVKYDASQYDERFKIWASILKELFDKFDSENWFTPKFKFGWVRFLKSWKENMTKYIINIIIFILTIVGLGILGTNIKSIDKIKSTVLSIAGIIPFILFVTNVLIPFIKEQLKFIQPLSNRIISNIELPDYKKDLGSRENIRESLDSLLKAWISESDEKIVIMVDELDRCTDKAIFEFFNALQLFLSVRGIVVILSVNYKTVCYSLANNHKYYFEKDLDNKKKIEFGIEYIKKYINIPIYLSTTYSYNHYIANIFNQINNVQQAVNSTNETTEEHNSNTEQNTNMQDFKVFEEKEEDIIRRVLLRMNTKNHITPREIKNIINLLLISKDICTTFNRERVSGEYIIDFLKFIKWFLFQYFYNKEAQSFVQKFEDKYNNMNIEEFLDEIISKEEKKKFEEDNLICRFFKSIGEIRIEEVKSFINISNCFIYSQEKEGQL
jgi:hypothetical protein